MSDIFVIVLGMGLAIQQVGYAGSKILDRIDPRTRKAAQHD